MSETADTKPSFRAAFKRRRCLILADGYYEWKAVGKMKQPYYHRLQDDRPFAFAGLWEHWEGPDGPVESCTILTTPANKLTLAIHDRMPAMLGREGRAVWLDPAVDPPALKELLQPYPAADMVSYPVSPAVNKAGVESAEFIVPQAG
jgi:putative SOS response-associated peptidase YedK